VVLPRSQIRPVRWGRHEPAEDFAGRATHADEFPAQATVAVPTKNDATTLAACGGSGRAPTRA